MRTQPANPIGNGATAGLLLLYFAVAVWGAEFLGGEDAPAPLIWPASGIGLALVLARGLRVWPFLLAVGVLAALYDGVLTFAHIGGALLSGAAGAFEAVLAAVLVWRLAGERYLARAGAFLLAVLVGAPVACLATTLPLALAPQATGMVATHSWVGLLETWHVAAVADWMGLLALTPPILLWSARERGALGRRALAELIALSAVVAFVLAAPAPERARYILVAAHLTIAMRLPLRWTAAAAAVTTVVYLSRSTFALRAEIPTQVYVYFLSEVAFAATLNVATYVTALLRSEAAERSARIEALARELSGAEHRERRRIAQILHDHLQQLLVAAKLAVSRLRRGDADAGEQADELIAEAITNARTLSVELHPPVLDTHGLAAAMQWLAREAEARHGLAVQVEAEEPGLPMGTETASFVVQATRELLLNVVKHAGTSTASLRLCRKGQWVEVVVADHGRGCDPEALARHAPGGYGLAEIRHRIDLLGGRFEMSAGEGCRITLRLPLRA